MRELQRTSLAVTALLASGLSLVACRGSISPNGAHDAAQDPVDAEDAGSDEPSNEDDASAGGGFEDEDASSASDAGVRDASTTPDASTPRPDASTGTPDAGGGTSQGDTVPVFVAMGYGSYRLVSCDYGLTWVDERTENPSGGDDGDLVRGLGAGNGLFVAAVGGGGVRKLWVSDDGVGWNKMMLTGNGYSDVAFGNGKFVAGGGHESTVSTDGMSWGMPGKMGEGGILRHLGFGNYDGGRFVGVGDEGRRMNSKDGVTWSSQVQEGPSLNGIDFGAGVFVAITSTSETRYSEDGGATWKSGNIQGAGEVRGILWDEPHKRFIVTTTGNTFTSTDGKSWKSNDAKGGPGAFAVSDDGKHYAGTHGGDWKDLMHSTDGINWTTVKKGKQDLQRLKFQRVKPSAVCPQK